MHASVRPPSPAAGKRGAEALNLDGCESSGSILSTVTRGGRTDSLRTLHGDTWPPDREPGPPVPTGVRGRVWQCEGFWLAAG